MRLFTAVGLCLLVSAGTAVAEQVGLDGYRATVTPDNRLKYTLATPDFSFTRITAVDSSETELRIEGQGEATVIIRFGGQRELSVERGGQVIALRRGDLNDKLEAIGALLNGRAVTAFRRMVGSYERELMNDRATLDAKSAPFGYGLLLTAAFVGQLAGDPNAVERTRDLIRRRIAAKVRAAAWLRDCVTEYELALLANDTRYTQCQESADSLDSWFDRASQRTLCAAEFLAGALSAETQFVSCSGLAPLKIQ